MKKILSILSIMVTLFLTSSCIGHSGPSGIPPYVVKAIHIEYTQSTLEFEQGEFDPTKITINVSKANGEGLQTTVTPEMIKTDVNNLRLGENTIEAVYNEIEDEHNNFTFYFKITILEKNDDRFLYQEDSIGYSYYITGYIGSDEVVTLPLTYNSKPVQGIADSAFLKDETLKVVYIPSGYTIIESAAFYQCKELKCVYIPSTVKTIGDYALHGVRTIFTENQTNTYTSNWYDENNSYVHTNIDMNSLVICNDYQYLVNEEVTLVNYLGNEKTITLPSEFNNKEITSVGPYAFAFNKNLEEINFSSSYVKVENNAFSNCENLVNLTLSSNLVTIEASAFCYCSSLVDFTFPETLEVIGSGAFNMCTSLNVLVIPKSVKTIEYYAFAWCTGLKELYIHNTLETFGQGAIYSCSKLRVYTEFTEAPSTWHENFNPSNRPITWNYEIK